MHTIGSAVVTVLAVALTFGIFLGALGAAALVFTRHSHANRLDRAARRERRHREA